MRYVISGNGAVMDVTRDCVLIIGPDGTSLNEMLDDPADNTKLSVSDLIEELEWRDDNYPPAELCDEAGLDSTLRTNGGKPWTWEQLAWAYRGLWFEETGEDPSENL